MHATEKYIKINECLHLRLESVLEFVRIEMDMDVGDNAQSLRASVWDDGAKNVLKVGKEIRKM